MYNAIQILRKQYSGVSLEASAAVNSPTFHVVYSMWPEDMRGMLEASCVRAIVCLN